MTPAPPKRGPGRPRKPEPPASPVPAIDDGLELRLRALLGRTVDAAENRLSEYEGLASPSPEQTNSIMKTGNELGVMLGHVRRHTESVRNAGRKLTMPVVIAWIREQAGDVKAQIRDECGEGAEGNVLG